MAGNRVDAFLAPFGRASVPGRTSSPGRVWSSSTKPDQNKLQQANQPFNESDDDGNGDDTMLQNRRKAMGAMSATVLSALLTNVNVEPARAYETEQPLKQRYWKLEVPNTFPDELSQEGADMLTPRQRALEISANKPKVSPLETTSAVDLGAGAVLWGSALWFLAGSRSNPLATPLANLLYNEDEDWLQDRNDGLFAALPAPLLILLGALFLLFGFTAHLATISLAEGSVGESFQLAGVLIISAGALEIGRIASGEKKQTRSENDRDTLLQQEFEAFAEKRLKAGGNCHRSEVVAAFRRFNAKYRQADNPDYPLNDLEIERLLKDWNERNAGAQRSSAGFYNGIQINAEADVFVSRL